MPAYDQVTGPNAMYNNPKLSEEHGRVLFESVHGTQMQGAKTDFVNLRSQEQALNRIDKSVKQPDPIVINNNQTALLHQKNVSHVLVIWETLDSAHYIHLHTD